MTGRSSTEVPQRNVNVQCLKAKLKKEKIRASTILSTGIATSTWYSYPIGTLLSTQAKAFILKENLKFSVIERSQVSECE